MSSLKPTDQRPEHWRSLDELAGTPEFHKMMEREFPSLLPDVVDPASRRTFLKLMGASVALAGLTACRWPEEQILPFARRPEGRTPGVPQQFATAMDLGGVARPLLVTSYDGRPVKVDGNPQHPQGGSSDILMQASILGLYDPDRSRSPWRREGEGQRQAGWSEFDEFARSHFAALRGNGSRLAVLAEASSSPTLAALRARLLETCPGMRWVEYEPVTRDNERDGAAIAWGEPLRAHYDLAGADVVVCLDADPLSSHPDALRLARDFATRRRGADDGSMNRLYAIESAMSVTGAIADSRFPLDSTAIAAVAARLAQRVEFGSGVARGPAADAARKFENGPSTPFVDSIADELLAHRGRGLVIAGPAQPPEVHALAHLMNERLGNVGSTVTFTREADPGRPAHAEAVASLGRALKSGRIDTLVIVGGNPVFDAPADIEFGEALGKIEYSIHLSLHRNETSKRCAWHLNRTHFLEAWGDARAWGGTISVVQPLIEPLFGGRSEIELVSQMIDGAPSRGYDLVQAEARSYLGGSGDAWRAALYDGFVDGSAAPAVRASLDGGRLETRLATWTPPAKTDGLEIVFLRDPKLYDGRFANNGWLQELPEPVTKLAWDNALLVSEATARELSLRSHETAIVELDGREAELPVFLMPGQADGSAAIWLGQGRTAGGRVAEGVGFDAYALRSTAAMHIARGAVARPSGRPYELASTQDHFAIDALGISETNRRRPILVREASLTEYEKHPDFVDHVIHVPKPYQLWQEHDYSKGYQWGMSIDLNTCIGCSACVVACQAENNIPVVGKQEVINGREMHWIRVDRYFKGDPAAPEVAFQPLTCHHCENAPCEQVCPVGATMHNAEGLNQMVYNRCVGTRYCSNNCPYKVRRFNFWNNQKDTTSIEAMAHNPEVTVRSRGVMEKCTYCVQRIESARSKAKLENRSIADGEVVPACEQACPTKAIVFGNLNDPDSRVSRAHAHRRSYAMLEELKVKPRTRYLAKIRNPAPGGDGEDNGGHESREHA